MKRAEMRQIRKHRQFPSQLHGPFLSCIAFALGVLSGGAKADALEFDRYGYNDPNKLTDQEIIAVGNITEMTRIRDSSVDNSAFPRQKDIVYQIGQPAQFCFTPSDRFMPSDKFLNKAGLLLVDKYSSVTIALLSADFNHVLKVDSEQISLLDCASISQQEIKDVLKRMNDMIKKNDVLIQSLKKQQQATKQTQP
jgi:hypothetical protein